MFFVDKYIPETSDDAHFNVTQLDRLKIMSEDGSIPHLIFYGPQGCGKRTVIRLLLDMIYGKNNHRTYNRVYNIPGSGTTTNEIVIKQSNNHIVIEPNGNNFDKYLIQHVIEEYAKRVPLRLMEKSKKYNSIKTILINNVDNLSRFAQFSLRRTMELYTKNCRFIMWSRSLSKVLEPIRSRSFCFKLNAPTTGEIYKTLLWITYKENIQNIGLVDYHRIINKADGNIKTAMWLLMCHHYEVPATTNYEVALTRLIKLVLSGKMKHMALIRDTVYKIIVTNIDGTTVIKDMVVQIMANDKVNFNSKIAIVDAAAEYEHRLTKGRRGIIHLEAFFNSVMNTMYYQKKEAKMELDTVEQCVQPVKN